MRQLILLAVMACVITACQTMDSVKSGFSNSYTKVSNMFTSHETEAPCPSFVVSDELDNFYDIPGADQTPAAANLSSAKIEGISGQCRMNDTNNIVTVSMDIDFTANAGLKENTDTLEKTTLEIPYFIAVLDASQEILAKDTFTIPLEISGAAMNTYHKERLQQNIPFIEGRDPSTYTIITGFQLDQDQLAFAKTQEKLSSIAPAAGKPSDITSIKKEVSNLVPQRKPVVATAVKAPDPDSIEAADPFAGR